MGHLGLPTAGLAGLPPELLLNILHLLPVPAVLNLGGSCKQASVVARDNSLWKHLVSRDFPKAIKKVEDGDWFNVYKTEYLNKKEIERMRQERLERPNFPDPMFPFHPPPDPDFGPLPPPIPGMVGGDYDRFPFPGGIGPIPFGPSLRLSRPSLKPGVPISEKVETSRKNSV